MTEFVASNGLSVCLYPDSTVAFASGRAHQRYTLAPSELKALREFFQAERDAELGRWRSKEHPDYVVHNLPDSLVRVTNEATGQAVTLIQKIATGASASHSVAREFFAAHTEPKPWHDAKTGEVWVIQAADWGTKACIVDDDYFMWSGEGLPVKSEHITAGRRIWPEKD